MCYSSQLLTMKWKYSHLWVEPSVLVEIKPHYGESHLCSADIKGKYIMSWQTHSMQGLSSGICGHDRAHWFHGVIANGDTVCGVLKLMWLRSISDDFQAAQFYTCCREQMVLADNVAGGGSMAEKMQRGDQIYWRTEARERRLRRCVTLIHITCMVE